MNKWENENGDVRHSEECPGDYWYPVVNLRRVRGSTYAPYQKGSAAWLKAANRVLASAAQDNFARGK